MEMEIIQKEIATGSFGLRKPCNDAVIATKNSYLPTTEMSEPKTCFATVWLLKAQCVLWQHLEETERTQNRSLQNSGTQDCTSMSTVKLTMSKHFNILWQLWRELWHVRKSGPDSKPLYKHDAHQFNGEQVYWSEWNLEHTTTLTLKYCWNQPTRRIWLCKWTFISSAPPSRLLIRNKKSLWKLEARTSASLYKKSTSICDSICFKTDLSNPI